MSSLVEDIRHIQENLNNRTNKIDTEQATKQWLIVPFIEALGYDMRKIGEVTPEADASLGVRKDKKVDYKISVNGQDVIIIECKQRNVVLSPRAIDQLFDYFIGSDAEIGILTNGDDYWFFTDTQKVNRMDKEPYLKLRISSLESDEEIIDNLEKYCKNNICNLDVKSDVKEQIFISECTDIARGIVSNDVPEYIVKVIANKVGVTSDSEINKYKMAEILCNIFKKQFGMYLETEKEVKKQEESLIENEKEKESTSTSKGGKRFIKDRNKASNIKLNHEYVFDDYSDGTWQYHKLLYCLIDDTKFGGISIVQAYANTVKYVLEKNKDVINTLVEERKERFRIHSTNTETFKWKQIDEFDLDIYVKLGANDIVRLMQFVLDAAGISHDKIKFSFIE